MSDMLSQRDCKSEVCLSHRVSSNSSGQLRETLSKNKNTGMGCSSVV